MDPLFELAAPQEGFFTTAQAEANGYSRQLLRHHVRAGKFARRCRGVYRFVEFPAAEHEDHVVAWLWSQQQGVVSHQSALSLYELSDVLPNAIHLTLPLAWRRRRLHVLPGLVLHHADLAANERRWFGSVPITAVARTLNDCARAALLPDLLRQAAQQALQRGMVTLDQLGDVTMALAPFGGIAA